MTPFALPSHAAAAACRCPGLSLLSSLFTSTPYTNSRARRCLGHVGREGRPPSVHTHVVRAAARHNGQPPRERGECPGPAGSDGPTLVEARRARTGTTPITIRSTTVVSNAGAQYTVRPSVMTSVQYRLGMQAGRRWLLNAVSSVYLPDRRTGPMRPRVTGGAQGARPKRGQASIRPPPGRIWRIATRVRRRRGADRDGNSSATVPTVRQPRGHARAWRGDRDGQPRRT